MGMARAFQDAVSRGAAVPYFMTLTFDRYDDRYLISSADGTTPSKEQVRAGLTRQMPPAAALDRRHADIRRFYIRLNRQLFGRGHAANADQPRGLGWLDRPFFKNASKRPPFARQPGDVFDHSHIALIVPTSKRLGREASVHERFEELCSSGALSQIWRRFNKEGEVHVDTMWDPYGALDYSAKTAKREDRFHDWMIILPCK